MFGSSPHLQFKADNKSAQREVSEQALTSNAELLHRALNYFCVAQIYLYDNCDLKESLDVSHLKRHPHGHWGSCYGVNLIIACLRAFLKAHPQPTIMVIGTGHAGASYLSWLFLQGKLLRGKNRYLLSRSGFAQLCRDFGGPAGFDTEVTGDLPGVLFSGGEIGPALSVALGASQNSPSLLVPCIIGDGELETGSALGALRYPFLINPASTGTLLPIVNLNGYRMGSRSILSRLTKNEIVLFFRGMGLTAYVVEDAYEEFLLALRRSLETFEFLREHPDKFEPLKMGLPVIVVRSDKGRGFPDELASERISRTHRSHKTPLKNPYLNSDEFVCLKSWLESYYPHDFFESDGSIRQEIQLLCNGDECSRGAWDIDLRTFSDVSAGEDVTTSKTFAPNRALDQYVSSLISASDSKKPFRVFSPDELLSNGFNTTLEKHGMLGSPAISNSSSSFSFSSPVVEILNEQLCLGMLIGYTQTGGQGVFITYEAFAPLVSSMTYQHIRFLEQLQSKVPSLNLIVTSPLWRSSRSHQNPDFINTLLGTASAHVEIYTPIDAVTAEASLRNCLQSTNQINSIYVSKGDLPVVRTRKEAVVDMQRGYVRYDYRNRDGETHNLFISIGDYMFHEAQLAIECFMQLQSDVGVTLVAPLRLSRIIPTIGSQRNTLYDFGPSIIQASTQVYSAFFGGEFTANAINFYIERELGIPVVNTFCFKGVYENTSTIGKLIANKSSRADMLAALCKNNGVPIYEHLYDDLVRTLLHPCGRPYCKGPLSVVEKIATSLSYI